MGAHSLWFFAWYSNILLDNQMNADKRDSEKKTGRQDPVDTIPVRPTGENFSVSTAAMETQLLAYNKKQRHGNEDREAPPPHI